MNTITIAEIKRHGLSAVEEAVTHGPVHLMKRNRPAAVLLSEEEYARLTAAAESSERREGSAALEWFLADQPPGDLDEEGLAARMEEARGDWSDR